MNIITTPYVFSHLDGQNIRDTEQIKFPDDLLSKLYLMFYFRVEGFRMHYIPTLYQELLNDAIADRLNRINNWQYKELGWEDTTIFMSPAVKLFEVDFEIERDLATAQLFKYLRHERHI